MASNSHHPETPELTPKFCFNQSALRDFFRVSRSALDDTISQSLNALSEPSRSPFTPSTVSTRPSIPTTRQLPPSTCTTFTAQTLFPAWNARDAVLTYCSAVASSPDPDDPGAVERRIEEHTRERQTVDERLDPYSGRWFPKEARAERLGRWVRNEGMVEEIIRERSWDVVRSRCGGVEEGWKEAYNEWRRGR
ncbi:hypothetical protein P152DRAFT_453529 [Eremomyces bilateralis CBS 781.70]|uniref:Caffeine-induced death protein Cid2 n=1 Tax=Eremomyces bilateralis CBS 781.70 TaxID=1392243 RepID=A0A6G1GGB9_9PEZI|nr:uncharacterized protein P152DRAFT_453529 [Eremomyces bilateralis CBS 781.70]KAF1816919.1 hypothetical protein P152DRAFT_453529 [Eremomyces bilateralis CBS 781.70]